MSECELKQRVGLKIVLLFIDLTWNDPNLEKITVSISILLISNKLVANNDIAVQELHLWCISAKFNIICNIQS